MTARAPKTALIFAGGVAKGAFEAGAVNVLVERGLRFSRIVATSSGGLNAALLAVATRAGRAAEATRAMVSFWQDEADWTQAFDFTLSGTLHGRGLSTSDKLRQVVREQVERFAPGPHRHAVDLRFVVTVVGGVRSRIAGEPVTRFESVLAFAGSDLDTQAGRERVYQAAVASAAFPILFEPVDVPGLGPCYDGSLVNDTPIKLAMDDGAERIVVVAPYPAKMHGLGPPHLFTHLAELLIHERLYRDLREAERTNRFIDALRAEESAGELSERQVARVLDLLGRRRKLEILLVRPDEDLRGNPFSGLVSHELRSAYIAAGRAAALAALDRQR